MTTLDSAGTAIADNAGMAEVETAVDLFQTRCSAGQSTVVVFYRGERSFFCKQWLRRWLAIPAIERRLELAGVVILFVSSQSQGKAYSVAAQIAAHRPALDARVFFFGDPEHLLVAHLGDAGFVQPVVTNPDSHRAHGWVFDYGMVQPAVLAIAADGSVLYQWVSKPSILNVAGKLDRPDPFDVWDTIERRLDRIRITKARAVRAARAAAAASQSVTTEHSEGPVSEDLTMVKAQPSLHSLGDVHPAPAPKPDTREEKSDSELATSMSRKTSDRSIIRAKDRQPPSARATEPRIASAKMDQELPLASGASTPSLRRNPESDGNLAPSSTNIETLTTYGLASEKTLSREEPDVSDGDIASIPVKVLSSNINALASEVLAENTMPLEVPDAEAKASSPGIAKREQVERIISGPLTEDFVDEFEDIGDTKVVTDNEEELDEERIEKGDIGEDQASSSEMDGDRGNELEDNGNDAIEEQDEAREKEPGNDDVARCDDEMKDETFSADEFEVKYAENDFVGSTKSANESRVETVVEPPTQRRTSELFDKQSTPVKDSTVPERHNSPAPDNLGEPVEARIPSLDSDQIETSMMASRVGSVRTEDSTQMNTYDASGLSPERQIVEEADDKKTGISDYLREMKDPEKRHYRVRGSGARRMAYSRGVAAASPATGASEEPPNAIPRTGPSDTSMVAATDAPLSAPVRGEKEGGAGFTSLEQAQSSAAPANNGNVQNAETRAAGIARHAGDIMSARKTERRVPPETDSPHPEFQAGQRSTVDVSPFADADHNINTPGDQLTKPVTASLRDEYEAYDEYIVCEFEVEEYVEEYDSDTTSRSRVFVTAVVDEESHQTGLTAEGKPAAETELPVIDETRRAQGGQGSGKGATGSRERAHVRIAETAREEIPRDVRVTPGTASEKEVVGTGGAMGSVRSVLRRFTIPVLSVARLAGSRHHVESRNETAASEKETAAESDAGAATGDRDASRLSRKDTIKAALRKPSATFYNAVAPSRAGTALDGAGAGETVGGEGDEQTAKLGRKETLKSVLRKIPVPKTRKRQHTAEGVTGDAGRELTRSATDVGEGGRGSQKKGGLQAVLQRLPSLSASGPRSRPAAMAAAEVEVSSERPFKDVREYVEADEARAGVGIKREEGKVGVGGVTWGSTMVKEVRESKSDLVSGGEEEGGGEESTGEKASEKRIAVPGGEGEAEAKEKAEGEKTQEEMVEDEEVMWGGDGRGKESSVAGMTSTPRARESETEEEGGKSGGGRFSRTLSRLRGLGIAEQGGAEAEAGEGERKIGRKKKTGADGEQANEGGAQEKVGAKKSLALVGGRILSRFRMG